MHKHSLALGALLAALASSAAADMGTAFTYQGRLCDGGAPANGLYDLQFALYNADSGGSQQGTTFTANGVAVSNGLLTVSIDFGAVVFNGDARWLEVSACTNGAGTPVALDPRQELTPTPYALYAANAGVATLASGVTPGSIGTLALAPGAVDSSRIAGGTILATNLSPVLLTNTFWRLAGNGGTSAGTHFVGTTDDQALELKVNKDRALRLEPTATGGTVNVIGGSRFNVVSGSGATIGGGGTSNSPNAILNNYATIGGGVAQTNESLYGTIGGGLRNRLFGFGGYATVGGGYQNRIGDYAEGSTISGGYDNMVDGSFTSPSYASTISGGRSNFISLGAMYSSIGGGATNVVGTNAPFSTIAGGRLNCVGDLSDLGAIGGGRGNIIGRDASYVTISGGYQNSLGNYSTAGAIGGGYQNSLGESSEYSMIGGGIQNRISNSAPRAVIGGGSGNQVWDYAGFSFIGGGDNNDIMDSANQSVVAGGAANSIGTESENSVIGGGYDNDISWQAYYATIGGGNDNDIAPQASYTTIGGGLANDVNTNADYATIPGGSRAKAANYGQFAYASGRFAAQGDAQASMFVLRRTISALTTNELFLDGNSATMRITVPTNSAWALDILVVGLGNDTHDLGAPNATHHISGLVVYDSLGTRASYSLIWKSEANCGTKVLVTSDAAHHLVIKAGGTDAMRWVANVRTAEVTYPQ